MKKGLFITFEGPDGSGKTTHAILTYNYLTRKGYDVVRTREPGGTASSEKIRDLLLDPKSSISPLTELLLYSASRAQHTDELIKPAIRQGKIVICDRFSDATIAYQGYGRKMDIKLIEQLNSISTGGFGPDLTILLDVTARDGLDRAKKIKTMDRLEMEKLSFHNRVRNGYLALAKKFPQRIKVIRTTTDIEKMNKKVIAIIEDFLRKRNYR